MKENFLPTNARFTVTQLRAIGGHLCPCVDAKGAGFHWAPGQQHKEVLSDTVHLELLWSSISPSTAGWSPLGPGRWPPPGCNHCSSHGNRGMWEKLAVWFQAARCRVVHHLCQGEMKGNQSPRGSCVNVHISFNKELVL